MQTRLDALVAETGDGGPGAGAAFAFRFAGAGDLEPLLALDTASWDPPLRFGRDRLAARLSHNPQGCLVLDSGGRVGAAVFFRTAVDAEAVRATPVQTAIDGPPGAAGDTAFQLLALVTDPATPAGLGAALLNHVVDRASAMAGIATVLGITRFAAYDAARDGGIEAYAARTDADGAPVDPVPRFHVAQGAVIEGLLPGIRPEDAANLGHGLLIRYPLRRGTSLGQNPGERPAPAAAQLTGAKAAARVRDAVRALMPDGGAAYDPALTVGELGLDSLALGDLRRALSARLGRPLATSFFFRCPTPAAMIAALSAPLGAIQPETPPETQLEAPRAPGPTPGPGPVAPTARTAPWEPIAIVGHAVRLPAGGDTPEAFMDALLAGRDGIRRVPQDRWDAEALTAPEPGTLGLMDSDRGGFLDRVDLFDPAFFGLSKREAARLDPQHRLLLEVAWEALERAGINPRGLAGGEAGVFVGQFLHDYEILLARTPGAPAPTLASATGNAASTAVGRLSYLLDIHGPCYSIEGACAASLMALHTACRALQAGETDCAIAGGVNLILAPDTSIAFSQAGMLARDGRCRTLDAAATGYGRGEGAGVFILKRLADAEADRDRVDGVIIGGALAQDGKSNGLVAPNGAAQARLMRKALATAGLTANDIDMVEMHGTGTVLGDAVEAGALAEIHAGARDRPLLLASVKTAIGHLEGAAGAAGLAKVLGSFARGRVPANLHYDTPSPEIDLAAIPARVPVAPVAWSELTGARPPVVGLSGFGFNGALAHLIVQGPPAPVPAASAAGPVVYPLSARDAATLEALAADHASVLQADPGAGAAAARTAATGRPGFTTRAAIVAADGAGALDGLRQLAAGAGDAPPEDSPAYALTRGPILRRAAGGGDIAFLFTGQGTHEIGMARELYAEEPAARAAIDTVDREVRAVLGASLVETLHGDDPDALDALAQPAILAIEAALDALWRSWGVVPARILGHSLGEFAAAVSAGVFSLEAAARIVAHRARLIAKAPGKGAMAVIEGARDAVDPMISAGDGTVGLAALNGPTQTVVSGSLDGVKAVMQAAKAAGRRAHRVPVPHAFHSPMMEPILDDFEAAVARETLSPPATPYLSSVTANWETDSVATPGYWRRHLRQTVRFREALHRLAETPPDLAVELGPRPVLVRQIEGEGLEIPRVASLAGDGLDRASLRTALAAVFVAGAEVDWQAVFGPRADPPVILPTSPYRRVRCWFTDPPGRRGEATGRGRETTGATIGKSPEPTVADG